MVQMNLLSGQEYRDTQSTDLSTQWGAGQWDDLGDWD